MPRPPQNAKQEGKNPHGTIVPMDLSHFQSFTTLTSSQETLEQQLAALQATLRPGQQELAAWTGGPMAVAAVPGAGKSYGMAVAAVTTIARQGLLRSRQLVVVTFTRSAAASIKSRIRQHLRDLGLPQGGFVVQTLHGLALNIASRYPELSGLNLNQLALVTPYQNHRLIRTSVEQWAAATPHLLQVLLQGQQFDGEEVERQRRQSVLRTEVLPNLAETAIHEAKSSGLLPEDLHRLADLVQSDYPVLTVAAGLYDHYQQLLHTWNLIDYDEMILAALRVLEHEQARQLWQEQVYAVFEDEAQDSTPLQTRLLETLAAGSSGPEQPNLVRVGDPNQAINSTFTPADPIFFRQFCDQCQAAGQLATMNQAGRSSPKLIEAANFLLQWVNQSQLAGTEQPFLPQMIQPVFHSDPQADANPDPEGQGLEIYSPPDVFQTVELIGRRVAQLLNDNPEARAAVLVRENKQGRFLAEVLSQPERFGLSIDLQQQGIEVFDAGSRDRKSHVPNEMLALLQFLDRPHSPDYLKAALEVLVNRQLVPPQDLNPLVIQPEQFLYPGPLSPPQTPPVQQARQLCTQLLKARLELPHDRLIAFLALTLQYSSAELATADKLINRIGQQVLGHHSMGTTLPVLQEIVSSERFDPVETAETEIRYLRSRQLTILTMHKAKGLDWDYVFLPFLHEQLIPGSLWVPTQANFLGEFTLAEVARAQIRAGLHEQYPLPDIPTAWQRAADLKTAEEFRLLYVAMTRAKRLLWMSAARKGPFNWRTFDWNHQGNLEERQPCPVLQPLRQRFPEAVVAI